MDYSAHIENLRDDFNTAAASITTANALFDADTTHGEVAALGGEAITAWDALPTHIAALDQILREVKSVPAIPPAAFFTPINRISYFREVEATLSAGEGVSDRGGRWQRLISHTHLVLNDLTTAQQVADHFRYAL